MTMAKYVRGPRTAVDYVPGSSVNAGDVIVSNNLTAIADTDDPVGSGGSIIQMSVYVGGLYQVAADAAYANGTWVYWNKTNSQITTVQSAGVTFPFGWIVGGPLGLLSDGGPTGSGSLCYILHDPGRTQVGAGLAEANTNITTVGAGTLTAAALASRLITRSGSTAAYTDTTDTAANLWAAQPNPVAGQSFQVEIKNTVAFAETLSGGTGVTLSGQTVIPPNSAGIFLVTLTNATAATMQGIAIVPLTTGVIEVATALTTVGAGTITAAGIAGGDTTRSGPTAAFTDTTDTAANIIAALPNANIGQSWEWTYENTTNFLATLAGGTGVTVSGTTFVPANTWARFLVSYTAANTVTIAGLAMGPNAAIPDAQYVTAALQNTTIPAADMAGAKYCVFENTGTTPATLTTDTAANIVAQIPNAKLGMSYVLTIRNSSGSANTATIAGGTGVTLHGTQTIAQNTTRTYLVQLTSLTAIDMYSQGISAAGA